MPKNKKAECKRTGGKVEHAYRRTKQPVSANVAIEAEDGGDLVALERRKKGGIDANRIGGRAMSP